MGNRRLRLYVTAAVFLFLTGTLVIMNLTIGSVKTPGVDIIYKIRLPRTMASAILGGALALSGFLLQSLFNNPIAGPYVLGISHGAKLAIAITLIVFADNMARLQSAFTVLSAFAGALLVMGFVLIMARGLKHPSMLLICGIMAGYICSAVTDIITSFASDASIINLHYFSRGQFSAITMKDIPVISVIVFTSATFAFLLSKSIGAYQMGESYAKSVGVNVPRLRVLIIALSGLLCAVTTAFAGPISFVGIAAPHLVKSFLKTSKPVTIIPFCFWCGMIICMGCDLIARTVISPGELSVGSVTAVLGAPVVIRAMLEKRGNP